MIHDKIRYNHSPRPFRCDSCGFVFLYPLMTPDIEKEFYEKTYRSEYDKQSAEDLWQASLTEAEKRVERFKKLYGNDSRLLEIGCASGYFLFAVKDYVKSVTGVELTGEYVTICKKQGAGCKEFP